MKGALKDQPLAELIREISTKELSGTLRIEHERAHAAIYFENGDVIFAASNLRSLRLREYLAKLNMLSEQELSTFGSHLSDQKLATLLCGIGKLAQAKVDRLFTTIVTDIVRVGLLWTEGKWDFDERAHYNDAIRVNLDTPNLLREAAQRLPLKFVSSRFINPKELISRVPAAAIDNSFTPTESFLLSRLDIPTTLEDAVALSGLRELDAQRVIYGLALSGLVERSLWRHAFRSVATKTKPAITVPVSTDTPQAEAIQEQQDRDLQTFLEQITTAASHYEVLDLPPTAEPTEIKYTYYTLARRYHPDRFHFQSGTPIHARISSAFAKVTQAYEALIDPKTRATYDATLKRTQQFAEAAAKANPTQSGAANETKADADPNAGEAEMHFHEGLTALQQGQLKIAVTQLGIAAKLIPDDARYRANYGRALAATESTRRLAENEMLAAVKLEPSNPAYRTLLAELYIELKFYRRAEAELEKALSIDANNAAARSLLKKMKLTGKLQ